MRSELRRVFRFAKCPELGPSFRGLSKREETEVLAARRIALQGGNYDNASD
jgi:hypothetical protein